MLRALDPDETPRRAYAVPWRIDRIYEAHTLVTNGSAAVLDFVRVFLDGASASRETQFWGKMLPGETIELCLCDVGPDDGVVTLAWFRPETGVEYLWRFGV